MRKIYTPTWSGGSSTAGSSSHHSGSRDKLSLLGASISEDDPNGVTNSSFDTNTSHYSSSRKLSMSSSSKQSLRRHSTEGADPVQFVAAHHEGPIATPSTDTAPSTSSAEETSWDAIANSDSFDNHHHHQLQNSHYNSNTRKASSVVVTPTNYSKRGSFASRSKLFKCKPQDQQQHQQLNEDTRSVSVVSSSTHHHQRSRSVVGGRSVLGSTASSGTTTNNNNNSSRIARLASLFSSRAVTPEKATPADKAVVTPSPPASESSSAYVAWPGTQDKRGGTVVVESSYEESSTGAGRSAATSSAAGGGGAKSYDEEVQEAVDRQVNQWMASDSASETSAPSKTASKQEPSGRYFQPQTEAATATTAHQKTPPRPIIHARADQEKVHRMATVMQRAKVSPLDSRIDSIQDVYGRHDDAAEDGMLINAANNDWDETMSDLSTSYSKTSSAYFNTREVQAIRKGHSIAGVRHNRQAAISVMRRFQSPHEHHDLSQPSTLTEESLARKDQMDPPHRPFNNASAGYRGLLDKTQDVPNLMDDVDSDSTSAASAATSRHSSAVQQDTTGPASSTSYYRNKRKSSRYTKRERSIPEEEDELDHDGAGSDVFDGISNAGGRRRSVATVPEEETSEEQQNGGILGATSRAEMERLNLALLGGGLTTIQTTSDDFMNRRTASDFDENLTNSDCDQYGFTNIPAFHKMAAAGMSQHDRSLTSQSLLFTTPSERARKILEKHTRKNGDSDSGSLFSERFPSDGLGQNVDGDLSQYYVHPDEMKIVVKKFRKMSRELYPRLEYEDLEREEDATKAFALSEMRSRIMETDIERGLERRGGTTVVDDIVTTPFNRAAMRVRDAVIVAKAWRDGATPQDVINTSLLTRRGERSYYIPRLVAASPRGSFEYTWEEVMWMDDLELSQYRCHSIGPRHLKGVEMFTIGDCQSILLKLCNERCQELRADLNTATAQQIEAEDIMKEEGETFDGMMTEAEMTYLSSMEEVKIISHKLVLAEKAFNSVRDRIEKLVAKYEALLVRFENETDSIAPSSVFTYESSCYSDDYSFATAEEREKEALARRAQRAEIRAELAAREALMAKQQAQQVRSEKERELQALKLKLAELQSESSAAITEREHSVVLARAITANSRVGSLNQGRVVNAGGNRISRSRIDDVKQRFRDRSGSKGAQAGSSKTSKSASAGNSNSMYRTVGEEMFQHLDFYERSLKAVETR